MTNRGGTSTEQERSQILAGGMEPQHFGLVLYVLTLLCEVPGMLARWAILSLLFSIIVGINRLIGIFAQLFGDPSSLTPGISGTVPTAALSGVLKFVVDIGTYIASVDDIIILLVTVGPVLYSIATFFLPGGFFLRRFALGAREPSYREQQTINAAIDELHATRSGIQLPRAYYIVDKLSREVHVIGTTLYVTRGALISPYLAALLAHALGHVDSLDGRLILALRRLVLFPIYLLSRSFGQLAPGTVSMTSAATGASGCVIGVFVWFFGLLLSLAGGGFGLWLLNLAWAWFWKQREYAADAYTVRLDQQGNMQHYLEELASGGIREPSFDIAAPFLVLEPPPPELRLDHLTYPENYTGTERINLRPIAIALLAIVIVFCGVPYTVRQGMRFSNSVEGTTWQLVSMCRSNGCDPTRGGAEDYLRSHRIMLLFTGENASDGVNSTSYQGSTPYGSMVGSYSYVEPNRILINVHSRQANGGELELNGSWAIERTGDRLRLKGSYATYDFLPIDKVPTTAAQDASAPVTGSSGNGLTPVPETGAQATQAPPTATLVGLWRNMDNATNTIELRADNSLIFNPGGVIGRYEISGTNEFMMAIPANGNRKEYTYVLEGNQLTLYYSSTAQVAFRLSRE